MVQKTDKRGGTIVASPAAVAAAVAEAMPPAKKAKVYLPAYATPNTGDPGCSPSSYPSFHFLYLQDDTAVGCMHYQPCGSLSQQASV